MAVVLFVRVHSALDAEELERRLVERRSRFRKVPGLLQKVYGVEPETGDVCGISSAYEATDVRRERYDVLYSLRPDREPLAI